MGMTANLHNHATQRTKSVQVQSQRAYPPFIAYGEELYTCRNVASASGDYDLLSRVTVIKNDGEDTAEFDNPKEAKG